ncbi:AAA family ATPase [Sphingomonas sp.]|uniref:AAA family ATPase n=1 Tax=Sphingomonas sp. TaxID=28214 RepID=UPI003CC6C8A6
MLGGSDPSTARGDFIDRCPTERLHVITGGPGSGKSTLIAALAAAGVAASAEVGRAIIREQVAAGGTALPWADERAFAELMLPREVAAHAAALASGTLTVLDRGVPDVIGFLRVSGLTVPPAFDATAAATRYNPRVFLAPFWAGIYTHDAERRQDSAVAQATEAVMRRTYAEYGYTLVDLPRVAVADRVRFVIDRL